MANYSHKDTRNQSPNQMRPDMVILSFAYGIEDIIKATLYNIPWLLVIFHIDFTE